MTDQPKYKKYVDIITLVIAVVGVPGYFYNQYVTSRHAQSERSLEFVTAVQTMPLLSDKITIMRSFSDLQSRAFLAGGPSNAALTQFVEAKVGEDEEFGNAVVKLVNHFDNAGACMSSGICNERILRDLLQSEAANVHRLLGPYINLLAERYFLTNIGCGLIAVAGSNPIGRCE